MEEKESNKQQNKIRKIYLDNLPHKIFKNNKSIINWELSVGKKVKGIYEGMSFELEIVKIDEKDSDYIYIKYLDKPLFRIATYSFKKCMIGRLLGKRTDEFKVEIGQVFKDDKRDIAIVDREYKDRYDNDEILVQKCKYYKYKCNKCDNEDWMRESDLLTKNRGCNVCGNGQIKAMLGINTIWDTDRWMCDLGVSEEDAKTRTHSSNDKITVTCPDCGRVKPTKMIINNIYKRHSIGCVCGDGYNYPNKLTYSILEQLNIDFTTEYSPEWIKPRRYDFYVCSLSLIIEMDGGLGHGKRIHSRKDMTKEESINIDKYKDKMALEHNINIVRIDCDYTTNNSFKYIKQNILNSKLNELFDLNKIDWLKAEGFALSNLVKKVCDYKRENPMVTVKEISEIMGINSSTINKYLKRGAKINWCYYNPLDVNKIKIAKAIEKTSKQVEVFKDNISLGIFKSIAELQRKSEEVFGVKLFEVYIINVCKGRREKYHGFTFKYVDKANDIDNISKSA